ncbi:MAG: UvrD-helicase domain-containing protein [Saprospirales bacterium]|nr:UvrD-helicase domain-containing protein [Saprospirales bacterium]MBK8921501.1 UvrD-helicase domain-containing protein [Saprospirales bacterium]
MAHYLDELNNVQRAAVTTTEGPVLVIAGPGSGKTRVLTYRIAHLLESGVPPWQILALTFTNKAAREMKERIEHVVGPNAQQVWAGTFHAVFARILRSEASRIGFPSNFSIYDTDDTTSLLRAIIKEMNLDPQAYSAGAIRSRISLAKSNLVTPKAYRDNADMMQQDRQAKRPYIADIYEKYTARCQRSGAMDFDDLLLQLYRLFRDHADIAAKYQQKFRYIHVDEFQDTNFLQYAILRRLVKYPGSPENIFIVGDDAQSIYAFRGATIDNILDFEKDYPTLQTFKLEQNYRSTHHIVSAANEVIAFNRRQLNKTIWTDREDRHKIKLVKCVTDDEEGRRVADLILEQKHRYHLLNAEIAILYRTNAQSRKFEEHLRRLNLPYRVFGGLSFYQRKEVKDLVAYLRMAVNPNDEEALRRVINYPARGISPATVDKISAYAGERNMTMWDAMLFIDVPDRARKSLAIFRNMVESWQGRVSTDTAYRLASDILRRSGLLDALKSDTSPEGIGRLENVNAVLDAISEFTDTNNTLFEANGPDALNDAPSLAAYLQTISLLTDADEAAGERDYITLMSTHSAKGLEYRSVFVTGLEENLFPSFMALEEPNGLDEERRLFYVAITRAKELLTISYAQNRYRYGQIRSSEPSRFLEEIDTRHFELLGGIGASRPPAPQTVANPRASVSGYFSKPRMRQTAPAGPQAGSANFTASPSEAIVPGATVLHLKFGEGKVKSVEGPQGNKVATIQFKDDELPDRRIVLRFAKLQVL